VAQSCMAIIEDHCKGNLMLRQAALQLVDLLPDYEMGVEAFSSYLSQLTEID